MPMPRALLQLLLTPRRLPAGGGIMGMACRPFRTRSLGRVKMGRLSKLLVDPDRDGWAWRVRVIF